MGAQPITLRCPACKVGEDFRRFDRPSSEDLVRTGREKTASRYHGIGNVQLVEVKHLRCGRIFWTNHPDGPRKPLSTEK